MRGSAGFCSIDLLDDVTGAPFPMALMYPARAPEQATRLGPYSLDVAPDAAPDDGAFPLVLISHGTGGSHLAYRTLAQHLARHGVIVGMVKHPHNNRDDNSLVDTLANLENRPRHIGIALDWLFGDACFSSRIQPAAVTLVGHSMGGYTALAVAGGVPTSLPHEAPDGQARRLDVRADPRVSALVLLAPAAVWFREPGALRAVALPTLMLFGERDAYTPFDFHGRLILDGVADRAKVASRIVANAGHFSFLSPFPPALCNPAFPPSQDPPGFDRPRFLDELHAEVLDFVVGAAR